VRRFKGEAEIVGQTPFGSDRFMDLASARAYELLCTATEGVRQAQPEWL
jgi:hypothetical protein